MARKQYGATRDHSMSNIQWWKDPKEKLGFEQEGATRLGRVTNLPHLTFPHHTRLRTWQQTGAKEEEATDCD